MNQPHLRKLISDYRNSREAIAELEKNLKDEKEFCSYLQRQILDQFETIGVENIRIDGRTYFPKRQLQCHIPKGNQPALVEVCYDLDMPELVSTQVVTSMLKSRIREWMGDMGEEDQIPGRIRELVNVHEQFTLGDRSAG